MAENMTTHVLDSVIVVAAILGNATALVLCVLQHRLVRQMTQMLAARSLGEWASVQKSIERPKKVPAVEGSDW